MSSPTGIRDLSPQLSPNRLGIFGFLVGALSVLAHLLGDVLTPRGIAPFWPVSSRPYSLDITKAANPLSNTLLFLVGWAVIGIVGAAAIGLFS